MRAKDHPTSFLAAAWFAAASCAPVIFVFWGFSISLSDAPVFNAFFFAVLPIAIAALCGFGPGSRILDPNQIKTSRQALVQGIKVGLLSYALFAPLFSLGLAIALRLEEGGGGIIDFIGIFFASLYLALSVGLIFVAWLLISVSAIAGWLLFKLRSLLLNNDS